MTDVQKQITLLTKQNEGMETSFTHKGVQFTKLSIENGDEPEVMLTLLTEYNIYLKNISKTNRPPPPPKPQSVKTVVEPDIKTTKPIDFSNEDELTKEEKITFPTICNMEDAKRAFFSKEYDTFFNIISGHPLKFYKATYKWSDDNDGKPEFIARNVLRGFVQGLEPYKKYFMVCFRCILIDASTKRYAYPSYWIVNTDINITTILGSLYDDYKFTSVDEVDVKTMLDEMKKSEDENLIGETYLH